MRIRLYVQLCTVLGCGLFDVYFNLQFKLLIYHLKSNLLRLFETFYIVTITMLQFTLKKMVVIEVVENKHLNPQLFNISKFNTELLLA